MLSFLVVWGFDKKSAKVLRDTQRALHGTSKDNDEETEEVCSTSVKSVCLQFVTVFSIGFADIQSCSWNDNEVYIEQTQWQCSWSGVSRRIANHRYCMLGEL